MDHRNLLAPRWTWAPAAPWLASLALAVLAAAGLGACQRQAQDASAIPHTPIPKTAARLSIVAEDAGIRYQGVVPDAATREAVVAALRSAVPAATGELAVEARTRPAPWGPALGPAAAALRGTGGRLAFTDRRIELGDGLSQEQRATLHRRIGRLFPGYTLAGAFQGTDPRHALPDEGDGPGLLAFLNASPIEFQADTGMLAPASVAALARIARGLQAAGPAARVEIHVRPEPGGDAIEQEAVARQRADAILTQLALRGVAPGRLRAVVDAPAGRGDKRFVEFTAFQPGAPATDGDDAATDTDAPGATDAAAAPGGESEDAEDTGDGAATRQPAQG